MKQISDTAFWDQFYKKKSLPFEPSLFSKYCKENFIIDCQNCNLIELGCGNGRDSIFFSKSGCNVTAVDLVSNEIEFLNSKFASSNLRFISQDFSTIRDFSKFNVVYSRFSLHAIDKSSQDRLIDNLRTSMAKNSLLFIEVRGLNNEYYGLGEKLENQENTFFYENHSRRFVDVDKLSNFLKNNNFNVLVADEKKGRSPFNGTDYTFGRIIATKT